jgi:hypothetical protein
LFGLFDKIRDPSKEVRESLCGETVLLYLVNVIASMTRNELLQSRAAFIHCLRKHSETAISALDNIAD